MSHARLLLLVSFLALSLPARVHAAWQPGGNRAAGNFNGIEFFPCIVLDGAGGAIVAWDNNDEQGDAQHFGPDGITTWGLEGTHVAPVNQAIRAVDVVSDGAAGAYIGLGGGGFFSYVEGDVYAQHLDADGNSTWAGDGVPICTLTGDQSQVRVASDGLGGMILVWRDNRSGTGYDIRAQRVRSDGTTVWFANGILVCSASGDQQNPRIISDGLGGAIIAWEDGRTVPQRIFAQRINAAGTPRWNANGVKLSDAAGNQSNPALVSDGGSGAIVTWEDERSGSAIYAQRVETVVRWAANGVLIDNTSVSSSARPDIASDKAGGAFIVWERLSGGSDPDVVARRVGASGTLLWAGPVQASTIPVTDQDGPRVVADGSGGMIMVWGDGRDAHFGGDRDLYAQRIDPSGTALWTANGLPVATNSNAERNPSLAPDGSGGAFLAWEDHEFGEGFIYAQHVIGSGAIGSMSTPAWQDDGSAVASGAGVQQNPTSTADGEAGALVGYESSGGSLEALSAVGGARVLRLDPGGHAASGWPASGVALSSVSSGQTEPVSASDGQGGSIFVWQDDRNGNRDIFAQHVTKSGAVAWNAAGVAVCTASGDQLHPRVVGDGVGGAVVCWEDGRGGGANTDIYASRILADGTLSGDWPAGGFAVCNATGNQTAPRIVADGEEGAVIVWSDFRGGASKTYAYRVLGTGLGSPDWNANGQALSNAVTTEIDPAVAPDGTGGVVVAWTDSRAGNKDIYGQRIDHDGVVQWPLAGLAISTGTGDQTRAAISGSGYNVFVLAWEDRRNAGTGSDVYVVSLAADGSFSPGWIEGLPACSSPTDQLHPDISADALGGMVVAWEDSRNGAADIYAMELDHYGDPVAGWPMNGFPLCNTAGAQTGPKIVIDGSGGAIVVWTDGRAADSDIYAMRVFGPVVVSPTSAPAPSTGSALQLALAPNPSRSGDVTIQFTLPVPERSVAMVIDVSGRMIMKRDLGLLPAGAHHFGWNGQTSVGVRASAGVYFARVLAGPLQETRRLVLTR